MNFLKAFCVRASLHSSSILPNTNVHWRIAMMASIKGSSRMKPVSELNTRPRKPPRNRGSAPSLRKPVKDDGSTLPSSRLFSKSLQKSGRDIVKNDIPSCSTRLVTVSKSRVVLTPHKSPFSLRTFCRNIIRLFTICSLNRVKLSIVMVFLKPILT